MWVSLVNSTDLFSCFNLLIMSSTRTAPRTTSNSKTTSLNTHHINGSTNSYDINDSTSTLNYPTGNNSE